MNLYQGLDSGFEEREISEAQRHLISRRQLMGMAAGGAIAASVPPFFLLKEAAYALEGPVKVFDGMSAQNSGVSIGVQINPPAVRRSRTTTIRYRGGRLILCGSASGSSAQVDDAIRVRTQKGTRILWSRTLPSTLDITDLFNDGDNTVTFEHLDEQGPHWGGSEVWVVNVANSDGGGFDFCSTFGSGGFSLIPTTTIARLSQPSGLYLWLDIEAYMNISVRNCAAGMPSLIKDGNNYRIRAGSSEFGVDQFGRPSSVSSDWTVTTNPQTPYVTGIDPSGPYSLSFGIEVRQEVSQGDRLTVDVVVGMKGVISVRTPLETVELIRAFNDALAAAKTWSVARKMATSQLLGEFGDAANSVLERAFAYDSDPSASIDWQPFLDGMRESWQYVAIGIGFLMALKGGGSPAPRLQRLPQMTATANTSQESIEADASIVAAVRAKFGSLIDTATIVALESDRSRISGYSEIAVTAQGFSPEHAVLCQIGIPGSGDAVHTAIFADANGTVNETIVMPIPEFVEQGVGLLTLIDGASLAVALDECLNQRSRNDVPIYLAARTFEIVRDANPPTWIETSVLGRRDIVTGRFRDPEGVVVRLEALDDISGMPLSGIEISRDGVNFETVEGMLGDDGMRLTVEYPLLGNQRTHLWARASDNDGNVTDVLDLGEIWIERYAMLSTATGQSFKMQSANYTNILRAPARSGGRVEIRSCYQLICSEPVQYPGGSFTLGANGPSDIELISVPGTVALSSYPATYWREIADHYRIGSVTFDAYRPCPTGIVVVEGDIILRKAPSGQVTLASLNGSIYDYTEGAGTNLVAADQNTGVLFWAKGNVVIRGKNKTLSGVIVAEAKVELLASSTTIRGAIWGANAEINYTSRSQIVYESLILRTRHALPYASTEPTPEPTPEPEPTPVAGAPTLLTPANGATVTNPITCTWQVVEGATKYKVQFTQTVGYSTSTYTTYAYGTPSATMGLPKGSWEWRVCVVTSNLPEATMPGEWSQTRTVTIQ